MSYFNSIRNLFGKLSIVKSYNQHQFFKKPFHNSAKSWKSSIANIFTDIWLIRKSLTLWNVLKTNLNGFNDNYVGEHCNSELHPSGNSVDESVDSQVGRVLQGREGRHIAQPASVHQLQTEEIVLSKVAAKSLKTNTYWAVLGRISRSTRVSLSLPHALSFLRLFPIFV